MVCILFLPTEINVIYHAGLNFTAEYAPSIFSKLGHSNMEYANLSQRADGPV